MNDYPDDIAAEIYELLCYLDTHRPFPNVPQHLESAYRICCGDGLVHIGLKIPSNAGFAFIERHRRKNDQPPDATKVESKSSKTNTTNQQNNVNARDEEWPRQATVARGLGKSEMEVVRLIDRGELRSNGKAGHKKRIDPASVLEYCKRNGVTYNDS